MIAANHTRFQNKEIENIALVKCDVECKTVHIFSQDIVITSLFQDYPKQETVKRS